MSALRICVVGMGLSLGGGIGMAMRQHGLACDNILAAQIVIANGSLVSQSFCHIGAECFPGASHVACHVARSRMQCEGSESSHGKPLAACIPCYFVG